jgi:hypothetical protein
MNKVVVGLAFDGDSNCTVVIEEYAKRMRLKKNRSGCPAIGFGSSTVKMGDLYEVLLKASWKRKITMSAVSAAAIYNGRRPCARTTSHSGSCNPG